MPIISSIKRRPFQTELKFFLPAILPRQIRQRDHAPHEILELAENRQSEEAGQNAEQRTRDHETE
jgi:hypothetical protein